MKYNEIMESDILEKKFSDLPNYLDLTQGPNIYVALENLTSLVGSPERVNGYFECSGNKLTTLVGGPKYVDGDFNCSANPLANLVSAPEFVGNDFICGSRAKSMSLLGITTKEIHGDFYIFGRIIGVLAIFNIRGITEIIFDDLSDDFQAIVNRHYPKGIRGMLTCQAELIAAGYKDTL